jgi:hypothetical protein
MMPIAHLMGQSRRPPEERMNSPLEIHKVRLRAIPFT